MFLAYHQSRYFYILKLLLLSVFTIIFINHNAIARLTLAVVGCILHIVPAPPASGFQQLITASA